MIQRVQIRHYKAIEDSKSLPLPAFAVFIGNNGSGKSSVFEALQLLHEAATTDLNTAFGRWGSLENVRHHQAKKPTPSHSAYQPERAPVEIKITVRLDKQTYRYEVGFNTSRNHDFYLVEYESLHVNKTEIFSARLQDNDGYAVATFKLSEEEARLQATIRRDRIPNTLRYLANKLFISGITLSMPDECRVFRNYLSSWQFLALHAQAMGFPVAQNRLTSDIRLQSDGRNLAEFIRYIAHEPDRLDRIIEQMKFVLPYASDIQTHTTDDFDRKIGLRLYEEGQQTPIPGWLFSSGTLRMLAILSVMESPHPPTVLFIDEVENGLDPRTIGLLINEFQKHYAAKQMQIVVTTHSPYLLDLVPLESMIVSEKTSGGTFFHLPKDEQSLALWRDKFSPGKLYTMGKLTQ